MFSSFVGCAIIPRLTLESETGVSVTEKGKSMDRDVVRLVCMRSRLVRILGRVAVACVRICFSSFNHVLVVTHSPLLTIPLVLQATMLTAWYVENVLSYLRLTLDLPRPPFIRNNRSSDRYRSL